MSTVGQGPLYVEPQPLKLKNVAHLEVLNGKLYTAGTSKCRFYFELQMPPLLERR